MAHVGTHEYSDSKLICTPKIMQHNAVQNGKKRAVESKVLGVSSFVDSGIKLDAVIENLMTLNRANNDITFELTLLLKIIHVKNSKTINWEKSHMQKYGIHSKANKFLLRL